MIKPSLAFFRGSVQKLSGTAQGPAGIMAVISIAGFTDATYLTVKHFTGESVKCTIVEGCDVVTTSGYSEIFGIPVALLGAFYYLAILLLVIGFFDTASQRLLRWAAKITIFGLIASAWFVYLQAVILDAWCIYCLGSAASSTLLFLVGMGVLAHDPAEEI